MGRQGTALCVGRAKTARQGQVPVIPLSLNGTKLGVLEAFFGEEPVYIPVSSDAGGVEAAMHAILVALRKRDPADVAPTPQPKAEPLEELVLELTDLKFHEQDGVRRASARARLVYEPATPGQREVASVQSWRLIAPIGPIEAGELRWYLEHYAVWPSHYFRTGRARWKRTSCVGPAPVRGGAARGAQGKRHESLGEHQRQRRAPLLCPRGPRARSRRSRDGRAGGPGSRYAAARPAVGTAARRRQLPLPGCEAHPRPPASAEYQVLDVPVVIRILLVTARPRTMPRLP